MRCLLRDTDADDLDVLLRLLLIALRVLNPVHYIHALHGATEDGVFAVEPGLFKRLVRNEQGMEGE